MDTRLKLAMAATGLAAVFLARKRYRESRERPIGGSAVFITGGSRGLGLAMARRFAREGCRIAICARDEEELVRARGDIEKLGAEVMTVRCDVTRRTEVERAIADVEGRFGRIDILVNNAGLIKVGPLESMTIDDFREAMDVMFWGTVYPTLALLPKFIARNSGKIVNITSIGAKVSVPHLLPYSAAKYAVAGFSEGLRAELRDTGVRVTTIAPGLMRTGSYTAALFKGQREAESNWFSVSASTPGLAMSADRAAGQIISAVKRDLAEKVLTLPASVLARAKGIAPEITQAIVGAAASYLLPAASRNRHASEGWRMPNLRSMKMRGLLAFGRIAARRLNQRLA